MFYKSLSILGLLGSILWSTGALENLPEVFIDNPLAGDVLTGTTASFGRAVGLTAPN